MTKRTARLYCSPTAAHQRMIMSGLCEAMRRDGWDAQVARSRDYVPSDLAVFWGHRQQVIIEHQRKIGGDYLVCERGYVGDRFYWTSLGFNGLNGRADFVNEGVPGDRWERYYADQLQPLRSGGDYALLIGQVPGDAALAGYGLGARLEFILVPVVFGVGAAMTAMVGANIGAGNRDRALRVGWTGSFAAAAIVGAVGLVFALFPDLWLRLFLAAEDTAALEAGRSYFRIVAPFYALFAAGLALYFASQGAGRVLWPLVGSMARMGVAIGGALVLGGWVGFGLAGVFVAVAGGMAAYGLVTMAAIRLTAWR